MKTYDKAAWHIDGGENEKKVIQRFKELFVFLMEKDLLTEEGVETLEYGMDSSISLNSRMLTLTGNDFLSETYDSIINLKPNDIKKVIEIKYNAFINK